MLINEMHKTNDVSGISGLQDLTLIDGSSSVIFAQESLY